MRQHAIAFLGRTLREDRQPVAEAVLTRLRELWMWRIEVATAAPGRDVSEFAGFGSWFASGKFEEAWSIAQLQAAVTLAGSIDHDFRVLPRLATLAGRFPLETVRIIARLLAGPRPPWLVTSWREAIERVLREAIASGHEAAKHEAEQLAHRLGRAGHFEFRDVLDAGRE